MPPAAHAALTWAGVGALAALAVTHFFAGPTARPGRRDPPPPTRDDDENDDDDAHAAADDDEPTDAAENGRPHALLNLLYAIAEDQARKEGHVHRGISCNHCGASPVRGLRYKCANCADFDLCESCEALDVHPRTHCFLKIRVPIPPLANPRTAMVATLYPGHRTDDAKQPQPQPQLAWAEIRDLTRTTHFDQLEIDALHDQFLSLTTPDSPDGIPRTVYDQALGPLGAERNLIADRVWSMFDADSNGQIGFREFVGALSVLCKGTLEEKTRAAFAGYDVDGDGRISRDELHAMFRAYFHLSMELVRDVVKAMEEEIMEGFDDEAAGAKPVSAAFTAPIPPQSTESGATDSAQQGALREKGDDPDAARAPSRRSLSPTPRQPPRSPSRSPVSSLSVQTSGSVAAGGELSPLRPGSPMQRAAVGLPPPPPLPMSLPQFPPTPRAASPRGPPSPTAPRPLRIPGSPQPSVQAPPGDRLQPIMEQMSQEAIAEMVDRTFAAMGADAHITYDQFARHVELDPTLISWFETLGSVF